MTEHSKSTHIGDGVYISDDGLHIWLAANHHENRVVALDPEVLVNMMDWIKANAPARWKAMVVLSGGAVNDNAPDLPE